MLFKVTVTFAAGNVYNSNSTTLELLHKFVESCCENGFTIASIVMTPATQEGK